MEYHMTLSRFVNKLFIAVPGIEDLIELRAAENYDEEYDDNYKGPFVYNGTIPHEVFDKVQKVMSAATLLCYGLAGGETDYRLNDLLSVPIGPGIVDKRTGIHTSPIIINSPTEIRHTLIEFPTDLIELLAVPKYIHAAPLDKKIYMKTHNIKTDLELKARGIDTDLKNWTCNVEIIIPEWCYDQPTEGQKTLNEKMLADLHQIVNNSRPIIVHCYSYTGISRHEISKHLRAPEPLKKID
jgi:hypothetical protein